MTRLQANLLLLLTAIIWGSAFVAQQVGMEAVGPLTFTAARFLLGALIVLPLAMRDWHRLRRADGPLPGASEALDWRGWVGLVVTGVALFAGATLQQVGLLWTTVTNAGFLTGLYVPMVPVLAWLLLRHRIGAAVWIGALGCVAGTYLLGGGGLLATGGGLNLNLGDGLIIFGAVFWALHVILVGTMATRLGAPLLVAGVQFFVCALLATIGAVATETITLDGLIAAGFEIAYAGVLSVGLAFTFQVVGQRFTGPSDAAIILSSEAVFAAIAGAVFLSERLAIFELVGCALILACIIGVQLAPSGDQKAAEAGS